MASSQSSILPYSPGRYCGQAKASKSRAQCPVETRDKNGGTGPEVTHGDDVGIRGAWTSVTTAAASRSCAPLEAAIATAT